MSSGSTMYWFPANRIRKSALSGSPRTSLRELNGGAANSVNCSRLGIRPALPLLAHDFGDAGRHRSHAVDEVGVGERLRGHGVLTRRNDHSPLDGILDIDRKSTRLNSSHVSISY